MAVTFVTWLWGDKYHEKDVTRVVYGIKRNYKPSHRFLVVTDQDIKVPGTEIISIPSEDRDLLGKGCFCRLRMFDPEWQRQHGLDDRIVSLDLDIVVTGPIEDLFERSEDFVILHGVNAVNPNPYNCSVMMLRAGKYPEVWNDFSIGEASSVQFHEFPDDQGWIWHKIPRAAGWKVGHESGIYGFQKPGWPIGQHNVLPTGSKIVVFIGWRKPKQFRHLNWVRDNWRASL